MRWDSRSVTLPPTGLPWGQEAAGTTEDVRPPGTPMPRWLFCDLQPLPCPLASAHLLCQVTSPCHIPGKALPASDSCRHPHLIESTIPLMTQLHSSLGAP